MPLLKNKSPKKPTTTDRGVPYGGAINSLINFFSVFRLATCEAFLEGSCATLTSPASKIWYEMETCP